MSQERPIEEIAKVMCGGCPNDEACMRCLCADWYRAEALYNAGYRKQSEWISVEERLPEKGGRYLVYMPDRIVSKVITARYNSESGRWLGAEALCYFEGITHWMPLPELPKTKG